jgi:hypothetical protein
MQADDSLAVVGEQLGNIAVLAKIVIGYARFACAVDNTYQANNAVFYASAGPRGEFAYRFDSGIARVRYPNGTFLDICYCEPWEDSESMFAVHMLANGNLLSVNFTIGQFNIHEIRTRTIGHRRRVVRTIASAAYGRMCWERGATSLASGGFALFGAPSEESNQLPPGVVCTSCARDAVARPRDILLFHADGRLQVRLRAHKTHVCGIVQLNETHFASWDRDARVYIWRVPSAEHADPTDAVWRTHPVRWLYSHEYEPITRIVVIDGDGDGDGADGDGSGDDGDGDGVGAGAGAGANVGQRLVVASAGIVEVWNLTSVLSKEMLTRIPRTRSEQFGDTPIWLYYGNTIHVFGECESESEFETPVTCCDMVRLPHANQLACLLSDHTVHIMTSRGSPLFTLQSANIHKNLGFIDVKLSPGERYLHILPHVQLAVAGRNAERVCVYDYVAGTRVLQREVDNGGGIDIDAATVLSDGRIVVTTEGHGLAVLC